MPNFLSDASFYNQTVNDEIQITGTQPIIRFTDSDTGGDSWLSASSTAASLSISADYNNEANTTKIYFSCDGKEVGHFRGDSNQVSSLRLFPEKNDSTSAGIFFGTAADGSGPGVGTWSDVRVISMDENEVLHLYPSSNTTGALQLTSSNVTAKGDVDVTGSVKVTQNLRRTFTTVTASSNTHTCNLSLNDNFIINAAAATNTIALTVASENVGQSGTIVINNASSGTVAFAALPSYMLTPDGASVNFVTTNSAVSLISYLVVATDKVLVNYVGNFS